MSSLITLQKKTKGGSELTKSITALLARWFSPLPRPLVDQVVIALLFIVGGPTFTDKLGLPRPYQAFVVALKVLGAIRGFIWSILPPRMSAYRLSEVEYKQYYKTGCPFGKNFINEVGPVKVLQEIQNNKVNE